MSKQYMSITTAVVSIWVLALSTCFSPVMADGLGSIIGGIVNKIAKTADNTESGTVSQANGYDGLPINGKVNQSVTSNHNFLLVQGWLDNSLKKHPNSQVRIVVTPTNVGCNHIQYSASTLGEMGYGWQCYSTNNVAIYLSPESGIGVWDNWIKSPADLHNKLSGPALKADGGVGEGRGASYQMAFSTGLTMLADNPNDYHHSDDRSGPKLPSNHNWLPNSIVAKKTGFTGNSNGYTSYARMFGRVCNDVESALSLQNHPQTLCWIN